jgi:hypothetical protein
VVGCVAKLVENCTQMPSKNETPFAKLFFGRTTNVQKVLLSEVLRARPAEGLKILSGTKSERHAIVDRL